MKMKYIRKAFFLFLIVLIACGDWKANAVEQTGDVVKVGFPIQPGTSYINERGDYAGYLVDYLHQLVSFTNWDIEFVQVDGDLSTQLETLTTMLQNGEIDMLGTMNRNAGIEQHPTQPANRVIQSLFQTYRFVPALRGASGVYSFAWHLKGTVFYRRRPISIYEGRGIDRVCRGISETLR